jgi:hypothetical protein
MLHPITSGKHTVDVQPPTPSPSPSLQSSSFSFVPHPSHGTLLSPCQFAQVAIESVTGRQISAMYNTIIFADNDEDEGDTQAIEEVDRQGCEAQLSPLSSLKLIYDDGSLRPHDPGDMGHSDAAQT